jgi:hypothetical protein
MKKSDVLGYVIYEGPSKIDGKPIAVVINKVNDDSANDKTGALVQSFIFRTDIEPHTALKTGDDESVCGDCQHRPFLVKRFKDGRAPCYVRVYQSVLSVARAHARGRYVKVTPKQAAKILKDRLLRLGTYGNPSAAPVGVWWEVTRLVRGTTGYDHGWKTIKPRERTKWQQMVMASVDSEAEQHEAQALGWRTFRVALNAHRLDTETPCPASREAGYKATCETCGGKAGPLCGGTKIKAKSIVIQDHASGHKRRVIPLLPVAA